MQDGDRDDELAVEPSADREQVPPTVGVRLEARAEVEFSWAFDAYRFRPNLRNLRELLKPETLGFAIPDDAEPELDLSNKRLRFKWTIYQDLEWPR